MHCWNCSALLDLPEGKIHFRTTCDKCHTWLHCCRNCINYRPGLPNDCKIPGTDPIADRTAANFCDEFVALGKAPQSTADLKSVSERLFGESSPEKDKDPKKRFDNLFD